MGPLQIPASPSPVIPGTAKEIKIAPPSSVKKVIKTSPLFSFVKDGQLEKLKSALLKTKKPLLKEKDETGKTILHYAVAFRKCSLSPLIIHIWFSFIV